MKVSPPFQVRTCGMINNEPYHSTPGTRDNDVMLTVFLSGRGSYTNKAGRIAITGGMVGLVEPIDAGILVSDVVEPYTHYYCRFNGGYAKFLAREIVKREGKRFFPIEYILQLADILRQMGSIARDRLPDKMSQPEILLARALVLISGADQQEGSSELTLFAIEHYLQTHITEPTYLDEIADYFNVSKSTLCRRVRQLTGKTVCQLSEEMKIEWAKILLGTKNSSENIAEIARRVGYKDALYFSKVFKKHIGVSPKNWRRGKDEERRAKRGNIGG